MNLQDENKSSIYAMDGVDNQQGAALYVAKVMGWMFIGLLTTAVSTLLCLAVPAIYYTIFSSNLVFGVLIGQVVLAMFFSLRLHKLSPAAATVSFMAYSALTGVTMSLIALLFELSSILFILGMTGLIFLLMAVYGYVTKTDLTSIGKLAMFGLIGVILAGVVNMFLKNTMVDLVVSAIAIIIFIGLIAYDTQKIKSFYLDAVESGYDEDSPEVRKMAIFGAFMLYLDFINLFIRLLRIFGKRRR